MATVERDAVTGTDTTGHEWDGIKELNTPLPKWWLYVFYACIFGSVVYMILFPAWPWFDGYTKGLLGYDQRSALTQTLERAEAARAGYLTRIEAASSLAEIAADPELLTYALAGGRAIFNENCAACHGLGGSGRPGGFPTLADDEWIWGGSLDAIQQTVRHGIRSDDPEARVSDMPAFGADQILDAAAIADVAQYLLALDDRADDPAAATRGQTVFADNCAACHGESAEGSVEFGAPNLADAIWLYGDEVAAIRAQVHKPRQGVMPAWAPRLSEANQRMVTIYVHSLGGGQ